MKKTNDAVAVLIERSFYKQQKPNAVFINYRDSEFEKVREYLKLNKNSSNIVVDFDEIVLDTISCFCRFHRNMLPVIELVALVNGYLIYQILKNSSLAIKHADFIEDYEQALKATKKLNSLEYLEIKMDTVNLHSLYEEIKSTMKNSSVVIFMEQLDYDYRAVQTLQGLINCLLNQTEVPTYLFTSNYSFNTYGDHINGEACEFYEYSFKQIAEPDDIEKIERFAIREVDSHLAEDYFYPQDQLDQIYLRKTYPINPDLSYLNHSELLSELPARVLPVSEEILAIYGETTLKDLYEMLQAEISNEKVISVPAKTILLGFNIFNKQLSKLERKQPLTGKLFMNQASFNQEMVNRSYDQFVEYLVSLLGNDPHHSFIPLRGLKRNGTMSDIRSTENLEKLLYLSEDRIKEILGIYYLPQKTADEALLKTAKKLIYSKNQIKSIFKHPSI